MKTTTSISTRTKKTGTKKKKKKRKRTGIKLFASVALASLFCFGLLGQTPIPDSGSSRNSSWNRSIEGTVLSSDGAPVAGAIVQIKDAKTLQVRSYIAQKDGKFQFWGLSNDVNYELRAIA